MVWQDKMSKRLDKLYADKQNDVTESATESLLGFPLLNRLKGTFKHRKNFRYSAISMGWVSTDKENPIIGIAVLGNDGNKYFQQVKFTGFPEEADIQYLGNKATAHIIDYVAEQISDAKKSNPSNEINNLPMINIGFKFKNDEQPENSKNAFFKHVSLATAFFSVLGAVVGFIIGGPVGAAVGAGAGAAGGAINGVMSGNTDEQEDAQAFANALKVNIRRIEHAKAYKPLVQDQKHKSKFVSGHRSKAVDPDKPLNTLATPAQPQPPFSRGRAQGASSTEHTEREPHATHNMRKKL